MLDFTESPAFRRRILDHLIWAMKGLTDDWDDDSVHVVPQVVDGNFYFPYGKNEFNKEITKWAVFVPHDELE